MGYLIAEVSTVTLFASFFALTQYERVHNVRIFSKYRKQIDIFASNIEFILIHVDFLSYIRDVTRHGFDKSAHDIAHLALQVTRIIEQQLTRVVRYFRARFIVRQSMPVSRTNKESSEFVKTIVDFKHELRNTQSSKENTNK